MSDAAVLSKNRAKLARLRMSREESEGDGLRATLDRLADQVEEIEATEAPKSPPVEEPRVHERPRSFFD